MPGEMHFPTVCYLRGMICRIERLGVGYSGATIFSGIAFQVDKGDRCGLSGDSGSGKTTLLRIVAGMAMPGATVTGVHRVSGRVGYIPQEGLNSLSPFLTVGQQVTDLAHSRILAEGLLARVGLSAARFYNAYPHRLSGGERQRVLIAQALALAPDLIVADEPTANLDPDTEARVLQLLDEYARETGAAILVASHREQVFGQLGCRVVSLTSPAERATPATVFSHEAITASVQHVVKAYRSPAVRVLEDVSFRIHSGECLAILGPSGAGKSTLARCIAGREKVDGGSVECAGAVQLVQQEPSESLNPRHTIRAAVTEACGNQALSLESVGLPSAWMERKVNELSEGQRARVAMLRSAESLQERGLLILDESFASLDGRTRGVIVRYLHELRRKRGLAILFITHDQEAASEMGARILRLEQGRIA